MSIYLYNTFYDRGDSKFILNLWNKNSGNYAEWLLSSENQPTKYYMYIFVDTLGQLSHIKCFDVKICQRETCKTL